MGHCRLLVLHIYCNQFVIGRQKKATVKYGVIFGEKSAGIV
jgi:hypothetical protein